MAFIRIRQQQIVGRLGHADLSESLKEELDRLFNRGHYFMYQATGGETLIELDAEYEPGTSSLIIFLNGLKVFYDQYNEYDSKHVQFVDPLYEGDLVEFRIDTAFVGGGELSTDHKHNYREQPIGNIDGINKVFLLSRRPKVNTEMVFVNGLFKNPGVGNDYVIDGDKITFSTAPAVGSIVLVSYETLY